MIRFIVSINTIITNVSTVVDTPSIEDINAMMLPVNEMAIESDPIFELFRGKKLFDYILSDKDLQLELPKHIKNVYELEIDQFIFYHFGAVYMHGDPSKAKFIFYNLKEQSSYFKGMSQRISNDNVVKLVSIKKGPIFKYHEDSYLLLDVLMLSEKICTQFINDFWFDCVKKMKLGGKHQNIKIYRGKIGYFYEEYVNDLFEYSTVMPSVYFGFDNLKINGSGGEIEIADVYLRLENKILLCQQKSSSVYDNEKLAGELEGLYKNDRSKFFSGFGVDQVVSSIANLDLVGNLDHDYVNLEEIEIYPCVILTDKSFQTPFMAQIFSERFEELLDSEEVRPNYTIKNLSILFINDLENIANQMKHEPSILFEVIDRNQDEKSMLTRPLTYTIHESLRHGPPMDMIMAEYKPLFEKFSKE
jgi:hypothetical protein